MEETQAVVLAIIILALQRASRSSIVECQTVPFQQRKKRLKKGEEIWK